MKCLPTTDLKDAFTQLNLNPTVFADGSWSVLDIKQIPHHPRSV
jgi:hypothetical protein